MLFRTVVAIYIISLFYNIPVSSVGQELKLYDIVMPFFIFHFMNNKDGIMDFVRSDRVSIALLRFCTWCSFTFLFTCVVQVIDGEIMLLLQIFSYLFHLWGFSIVTVFMRKDFLIDRKYFENTIRFILILGVLETLIILGQNFDIIPYLWSETYYKAYGDTSLSGTLGPNRVVPGSTMFLLFVVGVCIVSSRQSLKVSRILGTILVITCLLAIALSGSRTAYVSIGSFLAIFAFFSPRSILKTVLPASILVIVAAAIFNTSLLTERLEFMLDYRVFNPVERVSSVGNMDYYDEIGSGRRGKMYKAVNYLFENPLVIPFGQGFLNLKYSGYGHMKLKDGNSSHNLYLQMIIENGLIGLVLYLSMLFAFFNGNWRERNSFILLALIFAILVNLFFGENFYVYRTSFGLFGLLILVATIVDYRRQTSAFLENDKVD